MRLSQIDIHGFKSFAKKSSFSFSAPISAIVGPNGSGKSNIVDAVRFVLGEQSFKSLRGKKGVDLIFGGSGELSRSQFARVSLTLDNRERDVDVDYDEVVITREVARDGTNRYLVNGSQVRLRDIYEMLASVHIGASGHHIISQGQADQALNASPKDRKGMLEEALGLKIYRWKIAESERKLSRTEQNIREAELRRKELAPHLKYLKKQVEKFERAREMRADLMERYTEYLWREEAYISRNRKRLSDERAEPERELARIDARLSELAEATEQSAQEKEETQKEEKLAAVRAEARKAREHIDELSRRIGRLEGMIEFQESKPATEPKEGAVTIDRGAIEGDISELEETITELTEATEASAREALIARIRNAILRIKRHFHGDGDTEDASHEEDTSATDLEKLKQERSELHTELAQYETKERECAEEEKRLLAALEDLRKKNQHSQQEMYELKTKRHTLQSTLQRISNEEQTLARDARDLAQEISEAKVLVGDDIVTAYTERSGDPEEMLHEPRDKQRERRKEIERIKIRLEDIGGGSGEDVMKEYEEVQERDTFLAHEIEDLEKSAESLRALIEELGQKIDTEFKEGMHRVNDAFQEFFQTMFGGGTAQLDIVKEESASRRNKKQKDEDEELSVSGEEEDEEEKESEEEGVTISVSLPRKKIRSLIQLSGGERTLTSLALLFAITQVKPPPFLILDETDAALDEANSRKYGDMLETLSERSQLIIITHNRETMSRAGVLYGVTMGRDATSRVLSVKFDEAAAMTKS